MTNVLKSSCFVSRKRHYNNEILLHNNLSKTYKVHGFVWHTSEWKGTVLLPHLVVYLLPKLSSLKILLQDQQIEPNEDVAGTEAGMFLLNY